MNFLMIKLKQNKAKLRLKTGDGDFAHGSTKFVSILKPFSEFYIILLAAFC